MLTEDRYGFSWGPVNVHRVISDPTFGYVLEIRTAKGRLHIRVTPSGLIRVGPVEKPPFDNVVKA